MHLLKIIIIVLTAIFGAAYFYNKNTNGVIGIRKDGLLCLCVGIVLILIDIILIYISPGLWALPEYINLNMGIVDKGIGGRFIFIGYAFFGISILLFLLSMFKRLHSNNEVFK